MLIMFYFPSRLKDLPQCMKKVYEIIFFVCVTVQESKGTIFPTLTYLKLSLDFDSGPK